MSLLAPPPTYADLLIEDQHSKKPVFNPIWLDWFVTMTKVLNNSGGSSGLTHNSLSGLQGGTANEYYHATNSEYLKLQHYVTGRLQPAAPTTVTTTPTTISTTEFSVLFNGAASITVTLPSAVNYSGMCLLFTNLAAFTVVSASSNVSPLGSATPGTAILAATIGTFAFMQSDGTNWRILMAN
jgi:hypothetical protein